ncbi:MAG: DUF4347 domain-containing protein, partial [Cyanobacteria bacterium P01_D01_bin.56]
MEANNLALSDISPLTSPIGVIDGESLPNLGFQSSHANQLVVFDTSVEDYELLVRGIDDAAVLILDAKTDGIFQINSAIGEFQSLEALHIISHGSSGQLQLGATQLNADVLGLYENTLQSWDDVLTDSADVLIYGCNVGVDAKGQTFLDQFSQLIGADVAASTNVTGSSTLGGDWDFEFSTGQIETELALNAETVQAYAGIFANDYVVQTNPSFQKELVFAGIQEPMDMVFLPDGQMLFIQKNGVIQIADPNASTPTPQVYLDLSSRIQGGAEAGLLSIELDPDFETNNYFYIYWSQKKNLFADPSTPQYSADSEYRITRFTHGGNAPVADSEFVVYTKPGLVSRHHDGGGLSFGPDGKIYLTVGDEEPNAQTPDNTWDISQLQQLDNSYGKVLRINKDGTIPADNPFVDGPGGNLDEIWALGLRNPYRSVWDEESGRFFIGDVGGNIQSTAKEEINLGQIGANYGWPDFEGTTGDPSLSDPIYQYDHTGNTPNGGAVTAGFAYRGSQFPSEYEGAFFFGDYVLGWIKYLQFDEFGAVIDADPSKPGIDAFNFDNSAGTVVSINQAPDGSLYYAEIAENFSGPGNIYRITYNPTNQLPSIDTASADVTEGAGPLTVNFTGSASDGDGDPLTYTWSFDDVSPTVSGQNVSHTYNANGVYNASLQVSDGTGTVNSSPIEIQVGERPEVTITTSLNGGLFRAGDIISISANATDPDSVINETDYFWDIDFIHNAHTHPEDDEIGSSFSLEVPASSEVFPHGFSDIAGYRLELTVTDSDGLTDVETIELFPEKADLSISSNVPGEVTYRVDGLPRQGAFILDQAVDFQQKISAPAVVNVDGIEYTFDSWSDGSTTFPVEYIEFSGELFATFDVTVPEVNRSYAANYIITNVAANAVDDAFVVDEDSVGVALDVLANDSDPDGDSLSITSFGSLSSGGTVSINNANDGLIYTPSPNFAGVETFTYTITDGSGDTSQANVKVSIRGANDTPTAIADSFSVPLDSTNNLLDVLANDIDLDVTANPPVTMDFGTYEVTEVSTVSPTRAVKVKHTLSSGGLDNADFIFDATPDTPPFGTGPDPHFHMMGMPEGMRPAYLTQHNAGGTGETINFTMAREDGQAFAFESFSYTSGYFFPGTNAGFTVIGTLADGGEISQTFGPAATEQVFQSATLDGIGWENVTSVRFQGSAMATGTDVTQELNIDDITVSTASDLLSITGTDTTATAGTVSINANNDGVLYTPAVGFIGEDSFSYTIQDVAGESATAAVTVNVADSASLPITAGLVLNLDASEGVTTDGTDRVTGWTDQSGLGNDLT